MGPDTDDIAVLILWLSWFCLSTTNRALKNLQLDYVFPDENAMKKIMAMSPISFGPGLLETLQSATPPTIGYFKTLPLTLSLPLSQLWAIYLVVLEKDRERARVYIGSGTSTLGV